MATEGGICTCQVPSPPGPCSSDAFADDRVRGNRRDVTSRGHPQGATHGRTGNFPGTDRTGSSIGSPRRDRSQSGERSSRSTQLRSPLPDDTFTDDTRRPEGLQELHRRHQPMPRSRRPGAMAACRADNGRTTGTHLTSRQLPQAGADREFTISSRGSASTSDGRCRCRHESRLRHRPRTPRRGHRRPR